MFCSVCSLERDHPRQPDGRVSSEETNAVTKGRWGYMQSVINGMHAKFNSQQYATKGTIRR
jgi:hypothetical protein